MKKLDVFLLIILGLFFCHGIASAACQIQYDGEANRVLHLGGSTLRGNFATKEQCLDYWGSRPSFEQNHSECVGCDEQDCSQTQQDNRTDVYQNNNIRQQKQQEEAEQQQMVLRQKQKDAAERQEMIKRQKKEEERARAEFNQHKKKMLVQLKGDGGGEGLYLKGSGGTLALKSGTVPAKNPCAGRENELRYAKQRLIELRDDVKALQDALRLYRDGLLQHVSSLDRQSREIGDISDKILTDGIKYLRDSATGDFLKERFKFNNKEQYMKYENFIALIEQLKTEKDILSWLNNSSKDTTKLIEGADLLAGTVVPGWEHVKMNFRAWSDVGKECVAWLKINRLNRETKDYSTEIGAIFLRLRMKVEKINSLKRCLTESTAGCVQKCAP